MGLFDIFRKKRTEKQTSISNDMSAPTNNHIPIDISEPLVIPDIPSQPNEIIEEQKQDNTIVIKTDFFKPESAVCDSLVNLAGFKGFGFWIESVHTINRIFLLMQPAVDALENKGYNVKSVSASGGVQEFDTGYIPFSGAIYSSFEEAKENLPLAFAEEESKQAGSLLSEVNFEDFSIVFTKDNNDFMLLFSSGVLKASAEISELIPVADMQKTINEG